MSKTLTSAAVRALKPTHTRREVPDGGCRGLYLTIEPTGRKSWALRGRRPDGRTGRLLLGTVDTADGYVADPEIGGHLTLRSARALASRKLNELASGKDVFAEHQSRRRKLRSDYDAAAKATFPAMARAFVERYLRDRPDKKGNMRRNWWKVALVLGLDYRNGDPIINYRDGDPTVIQKSLCDRWATRSVSEITKADVRGVIDEARSTGIPGRAARTMGPSGAREREMSNALGGMFDWLLRHLGAIDVDPTASLPGAQQSAERDRVLSNDELVALWRALDEEPDQFARAIRLMILTGARRGEVMAMTWAELDKGKAVWTLPAARSKNKLAHQVPLSRQAEALLPPPGTAGPYVFSTDGGKTYVQGFGKMKYRLDEKLKFAEPWRFHDIRRSVVTGMAEIGIQPHIIETCVNHVSGHKGGVAGIYNKAEYAEPKRDALRRWALHVDRLIAGEKDEKVHELAKVRQA
jgi:integrase